MSVCLPENGASPKPAAAGIEDSTRGNRSRILIGVTSDQTCVVLRGRLQVLKDAGFDVTVVSSPGDWLDSITRAENAIAAPIAMRRAFSFAADLLAFLRLCRLIARLRPEIVDFSTPKCGLLGSVAARVMRVPRRVYTLRGLRLESSHGLQRWILWLAERTSCSCAHVVVCNSTSLREAALRLGIAPRRKLVLLGQGSTNGVDTERFSPGKSDVRRRFAIPEDAPVIGFVGRLTRHKGIPELMEAFRKVERRHPDAWLLLTGWFDDSEDALDEASRRTIEGHPRVVLSGRVDDPVPFYRAMDVFALPTHREGFPNAALEAASCGLPVITTDVTGARNAVVDGVSGFLVPMGDTDAIADRLLQLIADETLRCKLGRNARQWAMDGYERRKILALVVDFYRRLLSEKESGSRNDASNHAASANPAHLGEVRDVG